MGYCRQTALPVIEPVSLAQAKGYMRIDPGLVADDVLITGLIQAAREHAELISGRAIAQRTFRMVLDSMPYYTDTIQSQLAYPPSYYSLPLYSSTLWNYSQMIKMPYPPCISVQGMRYIGTDGNAQTLNQGTDFILDRISEPARIFPPPGRYWPPNLYVANSCEIDFTAGYDPDPAAAPDDAAIAANPPNQQPDSIIQAAIPMNIWRGILKLVSFWVNNRDQEPPDTINQLFLNHGVMDFAPSRG